MRKRQRRAVCMFAYWSCGLAIWLISFSGADRARASVFPFGRQDTNHDALVATAFVALTAFSAVVALLHMFHRQRMQHREGNLVLELNELRAKLDRAESFLLSEPQVIIAWGLRSEQPELEGDPQAIGIAGARRLFEFGSWLPPDQARQLEVAIGALRSNGEGFDFALTSNAGQHLEAKGAAIAGRAIVRLRDVSGDRLETLRLRETQFHLAEERDSFRALLEAVPYPAWLRDGGERLRWVNRAYLSAVEARGLDEVVERNTELLENRTREMMKRRRAEHQPFSERTAAVVAGWRRTLDVIEVPLDEFSIGVAFDVSELEAARIDLQHTLQSHARTLDQLATAVAVFDRRKQLVFHNAAYRQLWSLDQQFLEQGPSESEILDRLRARRLLPEQADFRGWKEAHFAAYQSPETSQQVWYLPDGRTLRVVINPNPQGGVTYLFEDNTPLVRLEAQFNEQTRVQRETLDTLKEGVAVFGPDGRMKLSNAAFAALWRLQPSDLGPHPHIDQVATLCSRIAPDPEAWSALHSAVAGLHDERTSIDVRLSARDGSILDCTAAPLPDGATLVTFTDTTASANVERALTERNDALLATEKLRNDFVHHFSYELRSPLTNIIGFSQLLGSGSIGQLNERQTEYVGYVMKSSAALHAIINDILDLATIDTGELELNLDRVDILATIRAATEGVQDRIAESSLRLELAVRPDIGSFVADGKRVRQILFNLLSNAIGFSAPGQTVTLAAQRHGSEIVFQVSDEGRGIPHDVIGHVFDRFHSNVIGSRHRGVGLGLSIVKSFVELHGGHVELESKPGRGTTVICIFPAQDEKLSLAANA